MEKLGSDKSSLSVKTSELAQGMTPVGGRLSVVVVVGGRVVVVLGRLVVVLGRLVVVLERLVVVVLSGSVAVLWVFLLDSASFLPLELGIVSMPVARLQAT